MRRELAAILKSEADVVLDRDSTTELAVHLMAAPIEVHPVQYASLPRYNCLIHSRS